LKLRNVPNQGVLEVGSVVIGRIVSKSVYGYKVILQNNKFGQVDFIEIADEWLSAPIEKY
jgi:hypothetical protein